MQRPLCEREGGPHASEVCCPGYRRRHFVCSINNLTVHSEMLAWLTYCLHLLTHSCTAFFFLVPWMCWFLSLLLGLCPRHCIISVFVFGSHGGGRYLHLDINVNIIHPQVNNSNKIQGPESPRSAWEGGLWNALGAGPPQHHCLGLRVPSCTRSYCLFGSCSPVLFWPINLNSASRFHL